MKIVKYQELDKVIKKVRKNKSVVFSSGVFDLFHYGHFLALKKASMLGDTFIVQIDANTLVKKRKGSQRPYLDESVRAEIISSFNFIDYVFISNLPSEDSKTLKIIKPEVFIRAIKPEESDQDRINRENQIVKYTPKTKVVWLAQTPEISTTKLAPFAESLTLHNENKDLPPFFEYMREIMRNLVLLILSPKDFLYSFTYSDKINIDIKNYNSGSKSVFDNLAKEFKKIMPNHKLHLVGSSGLGIIGEKDLDIVASIDEDSVEQYVKQLNTFLGKPKNITSNEIEWSSEINGYNVDFALINSKSKIYERRVQVTKIIKSNKLLWNKYLELKLDSIGINEREYDRRKMWFFKTIRYRLMLYERKINIV